MIIFWKEFEAGSMFSTNTDTLTETIYYLIISLICLERYRMMLWKNCEKFPANTRWQAILTPRNYTLSQGKEGREIQGAILIKFLLVPEETDGPTNSDEQSLTIDCLSIPSFSLLVVHKRTCDWNRLIETESFVKPLSCDTN